MAIVFCAIVAAGFARTLFLRHLFGTTDYLGGPSPVHITNRGFQVTIYPGGALPVHLLVHGLVLTSWYVLFLTQTVLIASSRIAVHRRLGAIGIILVPAVIATAMVTMARAVGRNAAIGGPEALIEPLVIGDSVALSLFAGLVTCAVYFRRHAATHKRLMLLAGLVILGPAFDRAFNGWIVPLLPAWSATVPGFPLFMLACIVALVAHDLLTMKRLQRATLWGTLAIILSVPLTLSLFGTSVCKAYVKFLGSL